jgi:hypothetical protein
MARQSQTIFQLSENLTAGYEYKSFESAANNDYVPSFRSTSFGSCFGAINWTTIVRLEELQNWNLMPVCRGKSRSHMGIPSVTSAREVAQEIVG